MAVDSAAKRFSIMDMGSGAAAVGLHPPDGTISASDRLALLLLYSGIAAGAAAASQALLTIAHAAATNLTISHAEN